MSSTNIYRIITVIVIISSSSIYCAIIIIIIINSIIISPRCAPKPISRLQCCQQNHNLFGFSVEQSIHLLSYAGVGAGGGTGVVLGVVRG